jgi:DNA helicase-2/ATP-dependent DNA helicase PcrA
MLHGQTRYNLRSRFLDELPEAALKWITPKRQGFGSGFATTSIANSDRHTGATRTFGRDFSPSPALALPPQKASGAGPNGWVKSGAKVFHNKFGEGDVVSLEGSGDDARAQVRFARHGVKWLALSVAKLTPV